jgi:hypothetical protein
MRKYYYFLKSFVSNKVAEFDRNFCVTENTNHVKTSTNFKIMHKCYKYFQGILLSLCVCVWDCVYGGGGQRPPGSSTTVKGFLVWCCPRFPKICGPSPKPHSTTNSSSDSPPWRVWWFLGGAELSSVAGEHCLALAPSLRPGSHDKQQLASVLDEQRQSSTPTSS